ncbi:MAG: PilW family protein [Gallionella sp.]|nr:PilW family protein [Gallionella sp.]
MTPNKPLSPQSHPALSQTGFTLVEIMVGLAIGMLATLVIMQVFTVFETQKRTTTGTADAQTNGSIALYNIGRELQIAGYPLMPTTNSPLECTTLTINGTADVGSPNSLTPVWIADSFPATTPAAIVTSDIINIRYGNSPTGGIPTTIGALSGNDVTVANNFGCQAGETTLITNGTTCAISSASAVTGTTVITLTDTTAATAGADIACLGTWNLVQYKVNNGNLERNGVPIVAGIVNLQAQFGISDAANSNQVAQWVDATGGTWGAPTVADRNRIKAIRIAVVARNPKPETGSVTTTCSSTNSAAPTGLCTWAGSASSPAPTINLNDPFDPNPSWTRYRYRVFETIIPLRNVIWSKDTL